MTADSRQFSDKEQNYHTYQARQEFLRQQRTLQCELDQALSEKQAALSEKQAALSDEQAALNREQSALDEINRLKAILEKNLLNS